MRPGDAGYATFSVRPDARTGVDWARTSIRTVRGTAGVAWSRTASGFGLDVRVPVGAVAEVHVPAAGRDEVTAPDGARYLRTEPEFVVYEVVHGRWRFTSATSASSESSSDSSSDSSSGTGSGLAASTR
ncbi:alpha-L-rhamnosidase C-terminal domain-containing protein [Streptomyces sp. NPDC001595]|uniref:alpha-L-rhamnosidase C-terminal domain-containing protein n=1 Tax=Streptomyces sp. NPDC001532 TaxID=3154520 RepID=UPI003320A894